MSIIKNIRTYIREDELKITILNNKINILNYLDIGHFDSNKILIKCKDKDIVISGENLVVSKLINDELLITGSFNNIEFR